MSLLLAATLVLDGPSVITEGSTSVQFCATLQTSNQVATSFSIFLVFMDGTAGRTHIDNMMAYSSPFILLCRPIP